MTAIYLVARSSWAQKHERGLGLGSGKFRKLLILLSAGGCVLGCASSQGTAFDRQLLLELEEQNTRLEAEVTRLREEKLSADRESDCSADKDPQPTAHLDGGRENLPVVEMMPMKSEEELESGEVLIRPAVPLPEEQPVDEHTRPVLKVHGQHEAWVYHRPVTAEDRAAKTDPVFKSKKSPEESN